MIVDIWLYPKKAKVAPITNASILVATANPNITLIQVGSKLCLSSSSLNDSTIICPPRKVKMPNAIQWSICSIKWLKLLVTIHPTNGISAWNKPKQNAISSMGFSLTCFSMMPLAMDTAKQSIAKLSATNHTSIVLMGYFLKVTGS